MSAEVFALMAATGYGSSQIAVRLGSRSCPLVPGLVCSLLVSLASLVPFLLLGPHVAWSSGAVVAFALSGLFGPGVARWASMIGVRRLGASSSVALQSGAYPLFAVGTAVMVLGESIAWRQALGLLAIVVGISLIVRRGSERRALPNERRSELRWAYAVAPILAGLMYGLSDVLRKGGLAQMPEPVIAAAIGLSSSTIAWLSILGVKPGLRDGVTMGRGLGFFALSGMLSSAGQLSLMMALNIGDVSVVSPIAATQPLIVVLLTAVVLRQVDPMRPGIVLGAVMVVAGVIGVSQ